MSTTRLVEDAVFVILDKSCGAYNWRCLVALKLAVAEIDQPQASHRQQDDQGAGL